GHWVGVDAVELDGEADRPGDAVDGQLALELVLVAAARDAGGAELGRGVALDAEEVGGAQVVVAVGLVGVDRRQGGGGGHGHVLERVAHGEGGVEVVEPAPYVGEPEVADLEVDARVGGVACPGAGDQGEGGGGGGLTHEVNPVV